MNDYRQAVERARNRPLPFEAEVEKRVSAPGPVRRVVAPPKPSQKEMMMRVIFGSAAPQAEAAIKVLQRPVAQKALGITSVAAAALFLGGSR